MTPATKESYGRYRGGSGVGWLTIRLTCEMRGSALFKIGQKTRGGDAAGKSTPANSKA